MFVTAAQNTPNVVAQTKKIRLCARAESSAIIEATTTFPKTLLSLLSSYHGLVYTFPYSHNLQPNVKELARYHIVLPPNTLHLHT